MAAVAVSLGLGGCQLVFGDFEFVTTDGSSGSSGTSPQDCSDTARRCNGDQPQQCIAKRWVDDGEACQSQLCNRQKGTCDECKPGKTRCNTETNQIETCDQQLSVWKLETDCSASMCDPAIVDRCVTCISGSKRCNGSGNLDKCSDDQTQFVEESICLSGACIADGNFAYCPVCNPGDTTCSQVDGVYKNLRTCGSDRNWIVTPCQNECVKVASGGYICGN